MKPQTPDFLAVYANQEPLFGTAERLLIMAALLVAAIAIIWWVRHK